MPIYTIILGNLFLFKISDCLVANIPIFLFHLNVLHFAATANAGFLVVRRAAQTRGFGSRPNLLTVNRAPPDLE